VIVRLMHDALRGLISFAPAGAMESREHFPRVALRSTRGYSPTALRA